MSIELGVESLQAALKVGVDEGLIKKEVGIQTYLDTWGTVNRMILAAMKQNKLEKECD